MWTKCICRENGKLAFCVNTTKHLRNNDFEGMVFLILEHKNVNNENFTTLTGFIDLDVLEEFANLKTLFSGKINLDILPTSSQLLAQ